jgi:hypothetical protein
MANPKVHVSDSNPVQPARIRTFNKLIALRDIEQYKDDIWKGTIIKDISQEDSLGDTIYFSRAYDRENNDLDRILNEYAFEDVLDYPFWLVPMEKCLFIYEPPSNILLPKVRKPRRPILPQ